MADRDDLPERRRLALGRATAAKIVADPSLLDVARDNLRRRRARRASPFSQQLLDEWESIVDAGPQAVAAALTDPGEHGHDLRQESPFAGVLTDRERWAVLQGVYGRAVG
jgi:hypothetical protein